MAFLFTIPSEKEPLGRNMVVCFCQIIFLIPNKAKKKKIIIFFREIDKKFF